VHVQGNDPLIFEAAAALCFWLRALVIYWLWRNDEQRKERV